jgi:hypothetical protein
MTRAQNDVGKKFMQAGLVLIMYFYYYYPYYFAMTTLIHCNCTHTHSASHPHARYHATYFSTFVFDGALFGAFEEIAGRWGRGLKKSQEKGGRIHAISR